MALVLVIINNKLTTVLPEDLICLLQLFFLMVYVPPWQSHVEEWGRSSFEYIFTWWTKKMRMKKMLH